jgi:hypothetical protein
VYAIVVVNGRDLNELLVANGLARIYGHAHAAIRWPRFAEVSRAARRTGGDGKARAQRRVEVCEVMPLEAEHLHHLTVAQGYLELGMFLDADTELDRIEPEVRHVPEVLEIRAQIYSRLCKWEPMFVVASALFRYDCGNIQWIVWRAFAARRAESLDAARSILREAVERIPEAAILQYNLACYECQLGELELAKSRLSNAIALENEWRALALDDDDLKPLWDYLARK